MLRLLTKRNVRKSNLIRNYWAKGGSDDDSDSEEKGRVVEVVFDTTTKTVAPVARGDKVPSYPHVLALPTSHRPLFPGVVLPMTITSPELSKALIALKEAGTPYVGVFLKKSIEVFEGEDGGNDKDLVRKLSQVHSVGSFAKVDNIIKVDENTTQVLMVAHRRIKIDGVYDDGPPLDVNVSSLKEVKKVGGEDGSRKKLIKAHSNEIVSSLRQLVKLNPLFKDHMQYFSERIDIHDPFKLADFAASVTTADADELQMVLEEMDCVKRLEKSLLLIIKEIQLSNVQQSIKKQVEEKISQNQRKYLLNEQLKIIKGELGLTKDEKDTFIQKYEEVLEKNPNIPKVVLDVIHEEMEKLKMLEKQSSEFNVTRNYLDWLTQIPWHCANEKEHIANLKDARKILDEDHYGLQDVKERILELIAVSKLKQTTQGKILCLVGPPGVGKTSIGKSIARSLNREFYRFSVGGLSDTSEIKGHRRTYVGAMPGKIIQSLKTTQSLNPVILIDEIDKLGSRTHNGDPASALLELLDPNQNGTFMDHYLDVPMDLSKVLFICTANVADTIPGPLLDRMEMLRLSGYDLPEKVNIAQNYLIPKTRENAGLKSNEEHGVTDGAITIDEDALHQLISKYCREAGVRNLEQQIEKIFRKIALKVVEQEKGSNQTAINVQTSDLESYVGLPVFNSDQMYEKLIPGVVMGLAWTSMGGSSLYIETTAIQTANGKGNLTSTGQMGSVMQESTKIAHTFARYSLHQRDPENKFFDQSDIHMHVPEGATPKDGPSAGCTMVTALLSLAMNKATIPDLAMTGEISLIGKILPVGGIKEKVIAARRANVKTIILPQANTKDWNELPAYLKEGITIHFADYYDDVWKVAFPNL